MKANFIALFAVAIAVNAAGPALADAPEFVSVQCDESNRNSKAFASTFNVDDCWRLRVICEGDAISGEATLDLGDDADAEIRYEGIGYDPGDDGVEQCKTEGHLLPRSIELNGIDDFAAECKFNSGAVFYVETKMLKNQNQCR
jgi:hypothetical protein